MINEFFRLLKKYIKSIQVKIKNKHLFEQISISVAKKILKQSFCLLGLQITFSLPQTSGGDQLPRSEW